MSISFFLTGTVFLALEITTAHQHCWLQLDIIRSKVAIVQVSPYLFRIVYSPAKKKKRNKILYEIILQDYWMHFSHDRSYQDLSQTRIP